MDKFEFKRVVEILEANWVKYDDAFKKKLWERVKNYSVGEFQDVADKLIEDNKRFKPKIGDIRKKFREVLSSKRVDKNAKYKNVSTIIYDNIRTTKKQFMNELINRLEPDYEPGHSVPSNMRYDNIRLNWLYSKTYYYIPEAHVIIGKEFEKKKPLPEPEFILNEIKKVVKKIDKGEIDIEDVELSEEKAGEVGELVEDIFED